MENIQGSMLSYSSEYNYEKLSLKVDHIFLLERKSINMIHSRLFCFANLPKDFPSKRDLIRSLYAHICLVHDLMFLFIYQSHDETNDYENIIILVPWF